ncbi:hypothetical protein D3C80_1467470 [compost metagenome]
MTVLVVNNHPPFHALQDIRNLHDPLGRTSDPQLTRELHALFVAADALNLIARALQHRIQHLPGNGEVLPVHGIQPLLDFGLQLAAPAALGQLGTQVIFLFLHFTGKLRTLCTAFFTLQQPVRDCTLTAFSHLLLHFLRHITEPNPAFDMRVENLSLIAQRLEPLIYRSETLFT